MDFTHDSVLCFCSSLQSASVCLVESLSGGHAVSVAAECMAKAVDEAASSGRWEIWHYLQ